MLIEEYQVSWIQNFEDIKLELQVALNELEYSIEHVGSTSVPNLAAKPIIDIDIIYKDDSEFKKIESRLVTIGYYHNGNQGIESREVFKRKGILEHVILDKVDHHLYVCPIHSVALKRHILFRDYLRENKAARLAYQKMKYKLAEEANQHKKIYAELKELSVNDFIDGLIGIKSNKN